MLTKLIYSDAFDSDVDVNMRVVESKSQMSKQASTVFGCDYSDVKPDKDHVGIHLVALGATEHYGCFFAGAPVTTSKGQKAIETVEVGDLVLTHKGNYKPVTHTFEESYSGDRVTIGLTSMPDSIVCTANHPFLVVRRDGLAPCTRCKLRKTGELKSTLDSRITAFEWAAAATLRPEEYLVIPTELSEEYRKSLPAIPAEYDPYVLGFYVAEGCLAKEHKDISTKGAYHKLLFTGSVKDNATWDYIDKWLLSIGRTPCARSKSYTSEFGVRMEVGFKELALDIDTWFGHLAHTKHLDPIIWTWNKDQRLKFLAGYFDGDGCLQHSDDRYQGTLTCSTVSRALACDLQRLLASVGVPASITRCYNKESNGCFGKGDLPIYSLSIGAYYSNIILAHTLRLAPHTREFSQAGASSMQLATNYALVRVASVAVDTVEDTIKYNLEVADDNSYVVDVQGHNSNRNGDAFGKQACIKYHDTFVKHGHVYRHHKNKDPKKSIGNIVKSAYNEPMGRIELFIHANREKCADELDTLEKTGEVSFSMACLVPFDRCSLCGTLRKTASDPDQCEHVKTGLGKLADDGSMCFVHNDDPKFFDISFVRRPADRIAWSLKTASADSEDSVKLASDAGLWVPDTLAIESDSAREKYELIKKLAEFEDMLANVNKVRQPDSMTRYFAAMRKSASTKCNDSALIELRRYEPSDVFTCMAKQAVVLSADAFFKYACGTDVYEAEVAPYMPALRVKLPAMFSEIIKRGECQGVCNEAMFDVQPSMLDMHVKISQNVRELRDDFSVAKPDVNERVITNVINNEKIAIDTRGGIVLNDVQILDTLMFKYAAYKTAALRTILKYFKGEDVDTNTAIAAAVAQHIM